jgi:hypothetical protein
LRHPRSWAFEVLTAAALGGVFGCGDDEPARDQTVFWMQLGTALGQTCSSTRAFTLPDESARTTIMNPSDDDERLVDGSDDSLVECTVSEGNAAGAFDLELNVSSGEIGRLYLRGPITKAAGVDGQGTFDMTFNTTSFSLQQEDLGCTGTVKDARPGAVWITNLSCPSMSDPSSPGVSCTGSGGFIAENCAD